MPGNTICQWLSFASVSYTHLDVYKRQAAPEDADSLLEELRPVVPSAQRIGVVRPYQGGKRIFLV